MPDTMSPHSGSTHLDDSVDISDNDLLAPLTEDEKKIARINSLNQRLEALADIQRNYLDFLRKSKKIAQELHKGKQDIDDELGRREARSKLDI